MFGARFNVNVIGGDVKVEAPSGKDFDAITPSVMKLIAANAEHLAEKRLFIEQQNNEALKVGDVVWLKSGGYSMTVLSITVNCVWKSEGEQVQRSEFPAACLTKYDPDEAEATGMGLGS